MATEEDKSYRIDYWARLFKATTWEEIRMIAKDDKYLQEASETLYALNSNQTVRDQCRARADYYRHENYIKKRMEELTAEKEQLSKENDMLSSEIDALKKFLMEQGISYPFKSTESDDK